MRNGFLVLFGFLFCCPINVFARRSTDLADIQRTALQYFLDNTNSQTGLVRDHANNFSTDASDVASIAATGFGLAVVSHAATVGFVSEDLAYNYDLRTLKFAQSQLARRNGWFLHFVSWSTGARIWQSEYSTIDTALFFAGALYAAQIFPDSEVADIANSLFREVDFSDYLTDGGAKPTKLTMTLSYTPENGYVPYQWEIYAEQMVMLIMGIGHPNHPLPPATWTAWKRQTSIIPHIGAIVGYDMPLFTHQYSQAFIDFRNLKDGGSNFFDNAKRAALYHRSISQTDQHFKTLQAGFWGFSAGASPNGYAVFNPLSYSSTVCVGCAVASVMFLPSELSIDIHNWRNGIYGGQIWGQYGFSDSLNLDANWFSPIVFGITKGPEYLAVANLNSGTSIWKDFMQIPAIKKGMKIARVLSASSDPTTAHQ